MASRMLKVLVAAAWLAAGTGCRQEMIPTPYAMYGDAGRRAFDAVPESLRTAEIPVMFVTDRVADDVEESGPVYGYKRSPDVAFGKATISLGESATWEGLVDEGTRGTRTSRYYPRLAKVEEIGSFGAILPRLEVFDGRLRIKRESVDVLKMEEERFDALVAQWAAGGQRDAVVFVHGYNNTFEDAVLRLGQAWHAGGRAGVPIVYTWPAGSGGLKGYAYDRESGEFTIVHLKMLLWALVRCPHIDRIHIISHSRGTDVATTALREINAEVRGALGFGLVASEIVRGESLRAPVAGAAPTYEYLKLETLILAAPDLDLDVFIQRFFGENLLQAARRTIVYFSKDDDALGLADWLFRSRRRLGALRVDDIQPQARAMMANLNSFEAINARVTGFTSHSYILQHPAALSDVIMVLRDGRSPGAEHGRPLVRVAEGIWELNNDYMRPGSPSQ